MNNKIKAVFFDIDGTLTSFKTQRIPKSTEKAIRILQEKQIKVIISTGRSIQSIKHIDYLNFDGFITFNGGYCVSNSNKLLYKNTIAREDINSLFNCAHHQQISFSLMLENAVYIYGLTPEIAEMYAYLNLAVPPKLDFNNVDVHNVLQTNIFMTEAEEKLFMPKVMPNSESSRWSPLFADVNPKNQSKRIGVDVFCKYFDIEPHHCIAFGDGGNDIKMLEHVGVGVAMGNANQSVKNIADFITDSVDDDGIWKALIHFGLI